ncbi:hypothetical protein [Micromonospora sp. NPDC000018]|uniref:hypothetical protein n=1 Tax=Micromonospora sp. NPDC000018 TaxID=3154239 RepID=UPI0033344DC7
MPRPKSDHATLVSAIIALLALVWGVFAYYFPRPAPTPAVSVISTPAPAMNTPTPSSHVSGAPSISGDSAAKAALAPPPWYERLSQRLERDRRGQSWWELALAWLLVMGFLLWRTIVHFDRVMWIPIFGVAFIYHFWPSLSWWGVTTSAVGGVIAWAIAGLESASAVAAEAVGQGDAATPPRQNETPA